MQLTNALAVSTDMVLGYVDTLLTMFVASCCEILITASAYMPDLTQTLK